MMLFGRAVNPRFIHIPGEKRPCKSFSADIEPVDINVAWKEYISLISNKHDTTTQSSTYEDAPSNHGDLGKPDYVHLINGRHVPMWSGASYETFLKNRISYLLSLNDTSYQQNPVQMVNYLVSNDVNSYYNLMLERTKNRLTLISQKLRHRFSRKRPLKIDISVSLSTSAYEPKAEAFLPTVDESMMEHKKVNDVALKSNKIQSYNTNKTHEIEDIIKLKDFSSTSAYKPKSEAFSPTVDEPMKGLEKVNDAAPKSNQCQRNNTNVTYRLEDLIKTKEYFDQKTIKSVPVWV